MSKAVLMSMNPKQCELVASGEQTVIVRKTKPKLETPFKIYIYCTKGEYLWKAKDRVFLDGKYNRIIDELPDYLLNGKVIGEFVCDKIDGFNYGVHEPYGATSWQDCYKGYSEELYDMEGTYLTVKEINDYGNGKFLYALNISNLVIYDKPKSLNEFKKHNRTCYYDHLGLATPKCKDCNGCQVESPPKSFCYVEELN